MRRRWSHWKALGRQFAEQLFFLFFCEISTFYSLFTYLYKYSWYLLLYILLKVYFPSQLACHITLYSFWCAALRMQAAESLTIHSHGYRNHLDGCYNADAQAECASLGLRPRNLHFRFLEAQVKKVRERLSQKKDAFTLRIPPLVFHTVVLPLSPGVLWAASGSTERPSRAEAPWTLPHLGAPSVEKSLHFSKVLAN